MRLGRRLALPRANKTLIIAPRLLAQPRQSEAGIGPHPFRGDLLPGSPGGIREMRLETRLAQPPDLAAIMEIYHDEVLHGTGTFDTEPLSKEKQEAWFEPHNGARYPLLVAVDDGRVLGWASINAWSERRAYDRTAEVSVYVHREHRRRKV